MTDFIKKPCQHCPYRNDVKPFLTSERGEELAYAATNPYNSFPCHKTLKNDDDSGLYEHQGSKQCAGFLTLMAAELGEDSVCYEGFKPSYKDVYLDVYEMADAYEEAAFRLIKAECPYCLAKLREGVIFSPGFSV